jgi:hypothetical protein
MPDVKIAKCSFLVLGYGGGYGGGYGRGIGGGYGSYGGKIGGTTNTFSYIL